jgi:hypothetical protein
MFESIKRTSILLFLFLLCSCKQLELMQNENGEFYANQFDSYNHHEDIVNENSFNPDHKPKSFPTKNHHTQNKLIDDFNEIYINLNINLIVSDDNQLNSQAHEEDIDELIKDLNIVFSKSKIIFEINQLDELIFEESEITHLVTSNNSKEEEEDLISEEYKDSFLDKNTINLYIFNTLYDNHVSMVFPKHKIIFATEDTLESEFFLDYLFVARDIARLFSLKNKPIQNNLMAPNHLIGSKLDSLQIKLMRDFLTKDHHLKKQKRPSPYVHKEYSKDKIINNPSKKYSLGEGKGEDEKKKETINKQKVINKTKPPLLLQQLFMNFKDEIKYSQHKTISNTRMNFRNPHLKKK